MSGIFKDKRVKNYRRAETGLRSIQTHLKKGEKGSMSVKHTPRAVFVFFMVCVCASVIFVFFFKFLLTLG